MKNEFGPNVVNAIAFDELRRLLQSEPRGLRMSLEWLPDVQKWDCHFVTADDHHYVAQKTFIGGAILYAIESYSIESNISSVKIEPPSSPLDDDQFFFIHDA